MQIRIDYMQEREKMKKIYTQEDFFQTVQKLKEVKLWGFHDYDVSRLLFRSVLDHMLLDRRRSFGLKDFVKLVLLKSKCYSFEKADGKVLLYESVKYNGRSDMLEIYEKMSNVSCDMEHFREKYCREIDFLMPIKLLYIIQWFYALKKEKFSRELIIAFIYDSMTNFQLLSFLRSRQDKIKGAKAFIVLNDEYGDENLFVQYGNKHGIPTATLQHGIYVKTINDNDIHHFMHIFYNLTADRIFMWGEYQKEVAVYCGVDPEKVITPGHPKYINITPPPKVGDKVIGVFLDGYNERLWKSNISIIDICNKFCKKFGYKYLVKIHPTDKENRYQDYYDKEYFLGIVDKKEAIIEFASKIEFGVVGVSSVYIEMMYLGIPVFRYYDQSGNDGYEGLNDFRFVSYDQFAELFSDMAQNSESFREKTMKLRQYYCGIGDVGDNYRDAITELCNFDK